MPKLITKITTCPYCETQNVNIEEHKKTIPSETYSCKNCDLVISDRKAYNCRSRECSKGLFLRNMQH